MITQDTGWRETKQRHWQPWLHKIQGEDKQSKDTGNLDYTRYSVKTNKTKTLATFITQDTGWRQTKQITLATLITQDTVWRQTKQRHWQPWLHKIQGEDKQNKDTGNLDYTRYRVKKKQKTKTLATLITQDTGWRQTKKITLATLITQDTVWRQTKQRHWQPWLHKILGEEKQNKDTDNLDYTRYRVKKSKTNNTGNLDYTRYRVKTNKTKTLATLITQDTGWRQIKQRHWQPWLHKIQGEDKQNKDTGNLDYTRYRVKTNKTNNTGNLDYTRYSVKTNKTKTLATLITQDTGWRQTKQITLATLITQDTVWRQTKQRHWQPWLHKIQGEDKQNKDTGILDYTRYRVKKNKTKTLATLITQDTGWSQTKQITLATLITQDTGWRQTKQITLATLITQDTGWRQTKQRHWQPWLHKIQDEDKQNK